VTTPDPSRLPVIVGIGQSIERDETVSCIDLMERAVAAASEDAPGLLQRVSRITTVDVLNDSRKRPATELATRLKLDDVPRETTIVGGNTPQWLITRTAAAIAAGSLDAALLAGSECGRSAKRGGHMDDATGDDPPDAIIGTGKFGLGKPELNIGLVQPIHIYPMFETARAAAAGRTYEEHRAFVGRLMAPFTAVAAKHPYAWFPTERTPEDLATVTADNRLTADPYTKRMNAIMAVDQGAALLMCSLAVARELGLADRAVFMWAGADCNDVWMPSARPDLTSSPGIRAAGSAALGAAGRSIDDMTWVDFYSCFPSAVQAGADALGVAIDDPRGLTVTGGLPYFGGPGNNYPMHSVATVVGKLRDGGGMALTTGLGWYITKHSVGIYGSEPPPEGFSKPDTSARQAEIDATAIDVVEQAEGSAVVDASTVIYERDGSVAGLPVFAHLDDGRRVVARLHEDDTTDAVAGRSMVGATIHVSGDVPTYRVEQE
jgi:acetyl-CoA C-acetyltransferase